MNQKDKTILLKIIDYCLQVKDTHDYFKQDKDLFMNEKSGFIYRNSITMPILQIGELTKMLSEEFLNEYTKILWKMISVRRTSNAHARGHFAKKFYVSHREMPENMAFLIQI